MCTETVRARKVDEFNDLIINLEQANMALDRYTWIVTDALPQTRQTIEESALTGVWATHNRDADIRLPASWYVIEKYAGF